MPYADAASRRADVRAWHARASIGLAAVATVCFVASATTHEVSHTWGYYVGSLVLVVAGWTLLHQRPQRSLLLAWPTLNVLGLYGVDAIAPKAAVLCLGTVTLAFIVVGLTQPRWTSLGLWPLAIIVWWQLNNLPVEQSLVRGGLATVVWLSAAELPAWLTERLTATQARLADLAHTDPLTGLDNRRAWQENLEHLLDGEPMSVLLVDLDHFKRYNDAHGHLAGDDLLVQFAEVLRTAVRDGDLVSRWGGEEFAIALPGVTGDAARAVADRILATVPGGESCSIGLTERRAGEHADALMSRADQALYQAKDDGRNRVVAA